MQSTIVVEKSKLLVILRENLELFNKIYAEAMDAFKGNFIRVVKEKIAQAEEGKFDFS